MLVEFNSMVGFITRALLFCNAEVDALGVKDITTYEELEKVKKNRFTLVDFSAPWCAPCRLQEPIIHQLAEQFQGRVFVAAMNIDQSRGNMAWNMGIHSIPTLIIFENGKEIQRFIGLQSKTTLSDALKKLLC